MNKVTVLAVMLVFSGFVFQVHAAKTTGCNKVKKEKESPYTLKLTEADAGKTITVDHKKYKKIKIELGRALVSQGNITAWSYGNHTGPLCFTKHKKVEPQKCLMGGAGTDVFSFKIKGTGIATVDIGHEEQLPDGTPSNRLLQPPSVHFEFDIK